MFRKSLGDLFKNPIISIPAIISGLLLYIFTNALLSRLKLDDPGYLNELKDPSQAVASVLGFMSIFLVIMLIYLLITSFITSWSGLMCRSVVNDEKPDFKGSFKNSFRFYWRMLGVIVLSVMIILGVYIALSILLGIPIVFLAQAAASSQISATAVILLVILGFIFVIAILFIMICILPVQPLLVYDDMGVVDALSKGFKFGLKKFFPILGVLLLVSVVTIAVTSGFNAISHYAEYLAVVITSFIGMLTTLFIMNTYRKYKAEALSDIPHPSNEGIYAEAENTSDNQPEELPCKDDEVMDITEPEKKNEDEDPRKKFTI